MIKMTVDKDDLTAIQEAAYLYMSTPMEAWRFGYEDTTGLATRILDELIPRRCANDNQRCQRIVVFWLSPECV